MFYKANYFVLSSAEGSEDAESDEEFDWNIEQVPSSEDFGTLNITGQQCGFGNSYSFSVFNLKVIKKIF